MRVDAHCSSPLVSINPPTTTYDLTIPSSASTNNTLLWSDTASQSSDDTSVSNDSDTCEYTSSGPEISIADHVVNPRRALCQPKVETAVATELRQNPRRTACGPQHGRIACPPALVRQCDRKVNFVDSLVDSSTQIVEAIWPLSSVVCRSELGNKAVLPLRTFIQETLRRSRTSYSTLQVALYYLVLIKSHVPKHNFTTEQPDDSQSDRALQCGRRMFLSALILASKYLQDRNYSARAWSKISGLNTQEINQNEIAFLLAVNWKLHIADEVFQRWTEIVLKYTPPSSPPSPGGTPQATFKQASDWKKIILQLNPELTNVSGLIPILKMDSKANDLCVSSPRSILNPQDTFICHDGLQRSSSTPKSIAAPVSELVGQRLGRSAPTLELLPTPRLTPQTSGFCTPAASAPSQSLGKVSAMGLAMAQVNCVSNVLHYDRAQTSSLPSPQNFYSARRSSLANSISTTSSPESMISDMSRSSRSSSISSVSSLASANLNSKLTGLRFRATKTLNDRVSVRPTVPSVPEDFDEHVFTSSPESYTGPVTRLGDLSLDTPLAKQERGLDIYTAGDPVSDAARALQDLHSRDTSSAESTPIASTSRKRSRSIMTDNVLQDNVRGLLNAGSTYNHSPWSQHLGSSMPPSSRKRLRCSTEVGMGFDGPSVHPAISHQGQGLWEAILN